MRRDWLSRTAGVALALAFAAPAFAEDSIYVPLFTYRTGPFAGSGTPVADGMHDYLTMLNERDGGIGGVKLDRRRMRDRLRHQEGPRVLRHGEAEEPGDHQSLVDRHHAVADPQGLRRQDPDPVDGLWPFGRRARRRLPVGVQPAGHLLGRRVRNPQISRRRLGRGPQGQDDRLSLFRRRVRPRGAAVLPVAGQGFRLRSQALSGRAGGHAEPGLEMARHPPRQARFPHHVRLGRDEPDGDQGSGQGQFPDGQVRLDLVAERPRRAPPPGKAPRASRSSTGTAPAPTIPPSPTSRNS